MEFPKTVLSESPRGYNILDFQSSQAANLTPYDVETYGDGTILIQLISPHNSSCAEPVLFFQIIHPNGTSSSISIRPSEIPLFNFCQTEINGEASVDHNGTVQPPGSIYYSKYMANTGFLYVGLQKNTGHIAWSHFTTPDLIYNDGGSSVAVTFSGFPGASGGFGLVVSRVYGRELPYDLVSSTHSSPPTSDPSMSKSSSVDDPVDIHLKVTASFIFPYGAGITTQFVIYSNPFPDLDVLAMTCNVDHGGDGNVCQLYLLRKGNVSDPYALKIVFQSIGTVRLIQEIYAENVVNADNVRINALINEGTLPQPVMLPSNPHVYDLLPNDTMVSLALDNTTNRIILVSSDLTKRYSSDPYSNPQINSTYPHTNAQISFRSTRLNITYQNPVSLSTQNISVFRSTEASNGTDLLRQTYSGQSGFCELSKDRRTVTITVFGSTFNEPNTKYYVAIDPNFVVLNMSNEPLLGVRKGVWNMRTGEAGKELYSGLLLENSRQPASTNFFKTLSSADQFTFFASISSELAQIIPTGENQLLPLNRYQYDATSNGIIFAISIADTAILSEQNSFHVLEDLNTLIVERDFTAISKMKNANDLWKKNKNEIIGFSSGLALLALVFFISYRKNRQAQNGVILKFTLIVFGFCLNVIFTFTSARNIEILYISSLSILVVVFVLEEISGILLIVQDVNANSQFYDWFKSNIPVVTIFTILSEKARDSFLRMEMVSFLAKDVPQLVIQNWYAKRRHRNRSIGVRGISGGGVDDDNEHDKHFTKFGDTEKNDNIEYGATGETETRLTPEDIGDVGVALREISSGERKGVYVKGNVNVRSFSSDIIVTKSPLMEVAGEKRSIKTTVIEEERVMEGGRTTVESTVVKEEETTTDMT
ncbi:3557_t:CDS:10 [Acaulospora colombiana]|uniref:3557_t:CDS:1 n=1 Tax=Acaulospora colombiana TaxID=27376 RepID=A0ACA9KMA2_9GLOM|nr:3557_t:CDS:10 [Acaulospora colombiana]